MKTEESIRTKANTTRRQFIKSSTLATTGIIVRCNSNPTEPEKTASVKNITFHTQTGQSLSSKTVLPNGTIADIEFDNAVQQNSVTVDAFSLTSGSKSFPFTNEDISFPSNKKISLNLDMEVNLKCLLIIFITFNAINLHSKDNKYISQRIISLSYQDSLIITQPDDFSIQMKLINGAGLNQKVYLPGFNTTNELIYFPVKLNSDLDSAVVIIFYNRSSSYGAALAFVVWKDTRSIHNQWWIEKAPCEIADVIDIDNDGIFEIVDLRKPEKYYQFKQGRYKIIYPSLKSQ